MTEPAFCRYFIENVTSERLEEIELITSGFWATDAHAATAVLDELVAAWFARSETSARVRLMIRLSLDWFHVQRLGLNHAVQLIGALDRSRFDDVGFYIRSVLLDGDTTAEDLAELLGAAIGPLVDFQRVMRLPSGKSITIYFKNLIVDGRMSRRKLTRLPVGIPTDAMDAFTQRFRDARGRHVPARVYNGPTVRHLDGLACIIEDDGAVKILEGNPPDRFPSVREQSDWDSACRFLYADPLTRYLVESGPEALAELLEPSFPGSANVSRDMNQLYYITDRLLSDPARLLYATVRVLELEATNGVNSYNASAMQNACDRLAKHFDGLIA